jgi:hypothetical protein
LLVSQKNLVLRTNQKLVVFVRHSSYNQIISSQLSLTRKLSDVLRSFRAEIVSTSRGSEVSTGQLFLSWPVLSCCHTPTWRAAVQDIKWSFILPWRQDRAFSRTIKLLIWLLINKVHTSLLTISYLIYFMLFSNTIIKVFFGDWQYKYDRSNVYIPSVIIITIRWLQKTNKNKKKDLWDPIISILTQK